MIYAKWIFNTILFTFGTFAIAGCSCEITGTLDPPAYPDLEVEAEPTPNGMPKAKLKVKTGSETEDSQ